ncbi:MAG: hypothetical protein AB7G23_09035 [Vicinamibacterales bacterium]
MTMQKRLWNRLFGERVEPDVPVVEPVSAPRPPASRVPRRYAALHKYLDGRYAELVVLTFGQIEDLLGTALPASARTQPDWWLATGEAGGEPTGELSLSIAWVQAGRTAVPNLLAGHVAFQRAAA